MLEDILPRLYERDIDVLLEEEVRFNEYVSALFSEKLGLNRTLTVKSCYLSMVDATGETDVVISYSDENAPGIILVENKIDAAFQPRQPERYRERAAALKLKHGCDVATVLLAPSDYVKSGSEAFAHFDATISYEELAAAVECLDSHRARHRSALIHRAISQARKSYVLIPAPEVTAFWKRVQTLAAHFYPELKMKPPGEKGSGSNWIIFKADLPANITIDWKIRHATVDLSFWRSASHMPVESIDLSQLGASTGVAGDTVLIRIPISSPPTKWTDMGEDGIAEALTAAKKLMDFYTANPSSFVSRNN